MANIKNETNTELIKWIEVGDYQCEAGSLQNNMRWRELKARLGALFVEPSEPSFDTSKFLEVIK